MRFPATQHPGGLQRPTLGSDDSGSGASEQYLPPTRDLFLTHGNDNTVSATEPGRWRSGRKKGLLNPTGASVLALGLGQGRKSHLHGRQRAWRDTASSFGACSEAWCHKGSQQGWRGQAHGCEPQPTWRAWFAQEVLPAAEGWQMKQRECRSRPQEGSYRAHIVAWPERYRHCHREAGPGDWR